MSARAGGSAAAGASSAPGGQLAAAARELIVPQTPVGQAAVCLEYPGYVGDIDNVLETLGGLEAIGRTMQVRWGRPAALPPARLLLHRPP